MKKITIVVIDDDEMDRRNAKRFLESAGFQNVNLSSTGEEGIEMVMAQKPELIVIDTILPLLDGFEVCRTIRETPYSPRPKIIVMTGQIDAVDATKARRVGADDYVVKTSDYAELLAAIEKLV